MQDVDVGLHLDGHRTEGSLWTWEWRVLGQHHLWCDVAILAYIAYDAIQILLLYTGQLVILYQVQEAL